MRLLEANIDREDRLEVHDSSAASAGAPVTLKGSTHDGDWMMTSTRELHLRFFSNQKHNGRGFLLQIESKIDTLNIG